jgi:uroporphyrinogen III methyltransferase/synthase
MQDSASDDPRTPLEQAPHGTGSVALVGAGPGDPDLITVKGRDRLAAADVVVYDRLAHPALLELAPPRAERIYIGKAYGRHVLEQEELNVLLVFLASQGKKVVRLKGGDPFVFGRGGEEADALAAAGIPFEIVPGISSAIAGPAYAGIPVTDRRAASSVTFATGHLDPSDPRSTVDWRALGRAGGTLVILMGTRHPAAIAVEIMAGGRDRLTPVAVVQRATLPDQRTVLTTLERLGEDMARRAVSSPAVLVVGEVVDLRQTLAWLPEDKGIGFAELDEGASVAGPFV